MNALLFQLRLLQPVLASQVGAGEENSTTTLPYIPGSAIRGAVIREYLQIHRGEDISQTDTGRKLFFNGSVCYLNAYPSWDGGVRMLPTPFSLKYPKKDENENPVSITDYAINPDADLSNPKSPPDDFAVIKTGNIWLHSLNRTIRVHNGSNQRMVKRSGESFVFRYEALAEGQVLAGVIISKDLALLATIQSLLKDKTILLGGSLTAEYGQVQVESLNIQQNWQETGQRSTSGDGVVTITLLSDAILRGEDGQYHLDLQPVLKKTHKSAFIRERIVGGFNKKWGLPLAQSIAIQAGSVFTYNAGEIQPGLLDSISESGVGERRVEGYGRVAVNWTNSPKLVWTKGGSAATSQASATQLVPPTGESDVLLKRILERRLRALLDDRLAAAVAELSLQGEISNSQLSRLRLAARKAGQEGSYQPVVTHLDGLKSSKKQLERARVATRDRDGKPVRISLFEWLKQNEQIWETHFAEAEDDLPTLGGVAVTIPEQLKVEYVSRLVEGLLRKTSRDHQKEGRVS
ncbi:MAG TPA: hypothetical protein PKJ34_12535 [Anaerolineaceae bacterium]|nr:hypothetical protein [Anaerolineaceae bacterium]HOH21224.1 hypothetical protein [Anaerolineaceae bacterium]